MNSPQKPGSEPSFAISITHLQQLLRSLGQQPLLEEQATSLIKYLGLLLRWNSKINLTAVRDEESILRRHFIESIQCARLLPPGIRTVLDYGSGGGFPGIPCAVCLPEVHVTLAESQSKKAAFLRETVRALGLNATVHGGRVEAMKACLLFDAVMLRAVDRMHEACQQALLRLQSGGLIAVLSTQGSSEALTGDLSGVAWSNPVELLGTEQAVLLLGRRIGE